ncbi:MAG: hypothetical protein ABL888_15000 [Pirellulaceae bacterium]
MNRETTVNLLPHFPSPRPLFLRVTTACLWMFVVASANLADELPDGFAEKSLAVEIRENEIVLEYRVGLARKELQKYCQTNSCEIGTGSDSELMSAFANDLALHLPEKLFLEVDGRQVQPQVNQARPGGQHHVSAMIELKVPFTGNSQGTTLKVIDRSFPDLDGAIRLACKGRGAVMLRKSNVAMLVVRANRIEFANLPNSDREIASTIEALILISPPSQSK